MAIRAYTMQDEILCEKCATRRADREYLVFQDTIVYLCEDCVRVVLPLLPFLTSEDKQH